MTPLTQPTSRRWLLWLAWLPLLITLANTLVSVYYRSTACAPLYQGTLKWDWIPTTISAVSFGVFGALIMIRQPRNRIGWLCGAIAIAPALFGAPYVFLNCAEQGLIALPAQSIMAWLTNFGTLVITLQFFLLPLLFPNGHFLSTGWRRFAQIVYGLLFLGALLSMFWPGKLLIYDMLAGLSRDNPLGLPFQSTSALTRLVEIFISVTLIPGILIANYSLFARWRRSDGQTRQQLKVFAFFLVTIGTVFLLFELIGQILHPNLDLFSLWDGWLYLLLRALLWGGYPLAIGISVLKYRMYDIDIVIRRTLVYASLTVSLALLYFGSVTLLQSVFQSVSGQRSAISIVVSTLAIAALFNPLRRRIQDGIDRRFYRQKYDAQKMLEEFAQTARSQTDSEQLSTELITLVQETLQPQSVTLWLTKGKTIL